MSRSYIKTGFAGTKSGPPAGKKTPAPERQDTLAAFVYREAAAQGLALPAAGTAVLSGLEYGLEIELKNAALRSFWKHHELPGRPPAVILSPLPRHYRTTSKRRWPVGVSPGKHRGFVEEAEASALEPAAHALIFDSIGAWLERPEFAPLARQLNFVVIRGTYTEFMVILNLQFMNRDLNRLLLRIVALLRSLDVNIISAFLYLDPSRSPYYLETDRPRGAFAIKKLFGPERFRLRLGSSKFAVPPTSFSQVNESILPLLLDQVRSLLAREGRERLLDLYCGYGLFSFHLRQDYREIVAIDASASSIRAARDLVPLNPGRARLLFKNMTVARNSLEAALPRPLPPGEEDVILDPPRRGADEATLRTIARRHPGLVLHLFCACEEIPAALRSWRRCGFSVRNVVPLDMFAGTPQLEVLVLLSQP